MAGSCCGCSVELKRRNEARERVPCADTRTLMCDFQVKTSEHENNVL